MKLKYDVIIIGGTLEGIKGAKYAAKLGARVGLILDVDYNLESAQESLFYQLQNELLSTAYFHHRRDILAETTSLITQKYLLELKALEVDLITAPYELILHKNIVSIKTNQDTLTANAYLLATTSFMSSYSTIEGMETVGYLTPYDVFQKFDLISLPDDIVIIGQDAIALNLATNLSQAQKKVTLLTENTSVLPQEEQEIAFLLQSQLEVLGVKIHTNCNISQVKVIDNRKWIQAGNKAIDTTEIIITDSCLSKKIDSNISILKKIGVNLNQGKIVVNEKLQTYHPQIYACGNLLGGYSLANVAQLEAEIALKNALFLPVYSIDYRFIPYTINTNPIITRIGYTEAQARYVYDDQISVITINTDFISYATLENQIGLIKIILNHNQEIIGCHIWGNHAHNLTPILSLFIQQYKTINELLKINFTDNVSQQIIEKIKIQWQEMNKKQNQAIIDILQTWFIWKR
jgi:pyruvate/2-oxoglutarate dehydrogenase complex dihydrolipoamide dehydrogenase (E3) component